ncbi:MAG: type VI secretion system tip protein TssI/VgrG [Polyangiales bacterium]
MSLSLSASIPGILGIAQGDRAPFELRVGPLVQGELVVRAFALREAVSTCFEADIEVLCDLDPMVLRPLLLAQPATLVLSTPGRPRRIVRGVLARVVDLGPDPRFELAHAWSLRLVPRLWFLSRRVNTRIYQDRTVPEVIADVLRAARVPFASRLARSYPRAEYILQYAETDLAFVQRLCAQEGIFTYFEPPSAALDELFGGAASAVAAGVSAAGALLGDAVADLEDAAQTVGLTESFVLCDEAGRLPPIDDGTLGGRLHEEFTSLVPPAVGALVPAPSLWYRPAEGMQGDHDDVVTVFARGREVAPTRVVMRDYDFRTPGAVHEASADLRTASVSAGLSAGLTVGLSAGGLSASVTGALSVSADLDEALGPRWMEVYDHRQQFAEPDTSRAEALTLLEQHRRDASFGDGASQSRRLTAGHRFTLDEHPAGEFNREYAVASVSHKGFVPALMPAADPRDATPVSYTNTFRCVPASVPLRPSPPPRRPQQVTELATVVGPPGEEIYTDALGRVRVHFPWDRDGRANHQSACWVRVVQPWAGPGWGHQFIPRVGMEVLVTFLGGDTDLPVIVGALYNGANAPPFGLPASKTRSGIRTSSSLGGGGHNELSFEDATGAEQVLLHAQRDWDASARRDHTRDVGRDERVSVRRDRVEAITRDHRTEVGGDRVRAVGGSLREEVRGGRSAVVEAGDDTRVNGDRAAGGRRDAHRAARRRRRDLSRRPHAAGPRVRHHGGGAPRRRALVDGARRGRRRPQREPHAGAQRGAGRGAALRRERAARGAEGHRAARGVGAQRGRRGQRGGGRQGPAPRLPRREGPAARPRNALQDRDHRDGAHLGGEHRHLEGADQLARGRDRRDRRRRPAADRALADR